jgi:hypothetical protein
MNALIVCSTTNNGDDMQALAVRNMMPGVDLEVDREHLGYCVPPGTNVVVAGWYKHNAWDWPPHPNYNPLFVGVHIAKRELVDKHRDYWNSYGKPVYTRDTSTAAIFEACGIEAYFAGCVTLTLNRPDVPKTEEVLAVDIPPCAGLPLVYADVEVDPNAPVGRREWQALKRLRRYAAARCVITSRLHVALPCVAVGTPVMLTLDNCDRTMGLGTLCAAHVPSASFKQIKGFIEATPKNDDKRASTLANNIRKTVRAHFSTNRP